MCIIHERDLQITCVSGGGRRVLVQNTLHQNVSITLRF